jgi:PTH1 family peptidyl-tRNA hydrolase
VKLVVGLGNVGKRYIHTRHNIGFMVVESFARHLKRTTREDPSISATYGRQYTDWQSESKLKAEIFSAELSGDTVILAKPTTMMNLSGEAVQRLMQKYRLKPADVWVIYDDVDIDFGRLRVRSGATSGQQGIRSIAAAIGNDFVHARMGISMNDRTVEPSEVYVLKRFNELEQLKVRGVISTAATILQQQIALDKPADSTFDLL